MIVVVVSEFVPSVTRELEQGAVGVLRESGAEFEVFRVPGAVELPVVVQAVIRAKSPEAVIALGCVVEGETAHFELVARVCADGLGRVALDSGVPVVNGVLACRDFEQAWARRFSGENYARTGLKIVEEMKKI